MQAGRIMLNEIHENVAHQRSFAFETTLSGKVYSRHIPKWRALGFHVSLFFLALDAPEIAIARVTTRVAQGGHNVPKPRFVGVSMRA